MRRLLISISMLLLMTACASSNQVIMGKVEEIGLESRQEAEGVVVELPSVFFEFGKFQLSEEGRAITSRLAEIINGRGVSARPLKIGGHTDAIGTDEDNMELSEARATAVLEELIFSQVDRARVKSIKGYGESQPLQSNTLPDGSDNPEGRARNRRVEILIEN